MLPLLFSTDVVLDVCVFPDGAVLCALVSRPIVLLVILMGPLLLAFSRGPLFFSRILSECVYITRRSSALGALVSRPNLFVYLF